jgi:5'-3' exonuclease
LVIFSDSVDNIPGILVFNLFEKDNKVTDKKVADKNGKPLTERQKKLASALRQNLMKRKQQQRERVAQESEQEAAAEAE